MSRPVLVTWEFGGGLGHVARLSAVAQALINRGFTPILAVQRLDSLRAIHLDRLGCEFFQAPLWPGLLPGYADKGVGRITMGDMLAEYGFLRSATAEYLLRAWDHLFARINPVAVVADFAPASLLAARGRIPTVSIGNGYTLPPAEADRFAILADDKDRPKHEEATVLEAVNKALARVGRQPLDRFPAVFAADRTCVACFDELDPFVAQRRTPNTEPFLPESCKQSSGEGKELFAYFTEAVGDHPIILGAIETVARAGVPVRVHIPNLPGEAAGSLKASGAIVEPSAIPFHQIADRSAMILSHGGLGLASSAFVAGIPHIVVPLDLEKLAYGRALERTGLGRNFKVSQSNPLEIALLAAAIQQTLADHALRQRARKAAPEFAARLRRPPAETVVDRVTELV